MMIDEHGRMQEPAQESDEYEVDRPENPDEANNEVYHSLRRSQDASRLEFSQTPT
jgi:hypothetical protein